MGGTCLKANLSGEERLETSEIILTKFLLWIRHIKTQPQQQIQATVMLQWNATELEDSDASSDEETTSESENGQHNVSNSTEQ